MRMSACPVTMEPPDDTKCDTCKYGGMLVSKGVTYSCKWQDMNKDECCFQCTVLDGRLGINYVAGVGDILSKVVFLGRDPGATENETLIPFTGDAGLRFDNHLIEAGIDRSAVFVTNTIHCQPERNRKPTDKERDMCGFNLRWELANMNPVIIVALGLDALKWIRLQSWAQRFKIMFVYHPASELYDKKKHGEIKKQMERVRKAMDEELDDSYANIIDAELLQRDAQTGMEDFCGN